MRSEKNNNVCLSGNSLLKKSLIAATGMLLLMSVYAIYWMLMAWQSEQSLKNWILEFEPSSAKRPDSLMGWTGSRDFPAPARRSFMRQWQSRKVRS